MIADPDAQAVVALLRAALAESGLSQAAFARALGTSGSRFSTYLAGTTSPSGQLCMRARRLARALATADRHGLMSAPATAAALRRQMRRRDLPWTWRTLVQGRDHLRLALESGDEDLLGSWEAAPTTTSSAEFDALLAALTRHEFVAAHRRAPEWTTTPPLAQAWIPEHPFLTADRVVAETPPWLRELNIFVPERDLITA
jgi:transcriptional regulator with XRE-family HTH domain